MNAGRTISATIVIIFLAGAQRGLCSAGGEEDCGYLFAVRATTPQGASCAVGKYWQIHSFLGSEPKLYFSKLFLKFEPGLYGGKLHIGVGNLDPGSAGMGIMPMPPSAGAVKLSALHTWGHPIGGVEPNQTYLGLEGEVMFCGLNATAGGYAHVAGNADGPEWIFSGGIGIGF